MSFYELMRFLLDEQVWVAEKKLVVSNNSYLAAFTATGTGHLSWYIAKEQSGIIQISREINMKWEQVFT